MRAHSYIRFLNHAEAHALAIEKIAKRVQNKAEEEDLLRLLGITPLEDAKKQYHNAIIQARTARAPSRDWPVDNHSHPFGFGTVSIVGDAWRSSTLLFDLLLIAYLRNTSKMQVELVTNVYTHTRFENRFEAALRAEIAKEVLVSRIPSSYSIWGPTMMDVEALRENRFLKDFRSMLAAQPLPSSYREAQLLALEIEKQFQNYRNDVLLKLHKESGVVSSIARIIGTRVIDEVIPGFSDALELKEAKETRSMNWAAFLASVSSQSSRAI